MEEIKASFERQLEEFRKQIAKVESKVDEKEKLYSNLSQLQNELNKVKNRDELEEFRKIKKKLDDFAETMD